MDRHISWLVLASLLSLARPASGRKSVSDYQNGIHGDAAFADYALIIGVMRRF